MLNADRISARSPITSIFQLKNDDESGIFNIDPAVVDHGELNVTSEYVSPGMSGIADYVNIPIKRDVNSIHYGYQKAKGFRKGKEAYTPKPSDRVVMERFRFHNQHWYAYGCFYSFRMNLFNGTIVFDFSSEQDEEITSQEAMRLMSSKRHFQISTNTDFFDSSVKIKHSQSFYNATLFSFRHKGKKIIAIEHYDDEFLTRYWHILYQDGTMKNVIADRLTKEVLDV